MELTEREFLAIWNAVRAILPNKRGWPCSICGKRYKDQDGAGWCCFNKKESEDHPAHESVEK
jgi:hypothetical protein